MNTIQIKSFLTAAELLNFTKAAEKLYISQSVLSRQIASLEQELGITLFIRERNSVTLTKAGKIFAKGMTELKKAFDNLMAEASIAQRGLEGIINIGSADGQQIGENYSDVIMYIWNNYPDLKTNLSYHSLSELKAALLDGEIDIAIIAKSEIEDLEGIEYKISKVSDSYLVIPKRHPKSNSKNPTLKDFSDETFLIMAESESKNIAKQQLKTWASIGVAPKLQVVPTISTLASLLEAGIGISTLNGWHSLRHSPHLKFIKVPELEKNTEVIAWRKDNDNKGIEIFLSRIGEDTDKHNS